jgi:ABC-2 type transport system permease protein
VGGAAVTLGAFVSPLIGGPEDPLDPRRFAPVGVAAGPLAGVVLAASFVSVPVLALVAVSASLVVLWQAHGVPVGLGVLAAVLGVVTCVLLTKIAHALASRMLRQRRSRELTGLFLVTLLVVVVPVVVFVASLEWRGRVPSQLMEAVGVLSVTPLGAAWGMPWRSLDGDVTWSIVVAAGTVVVLTGAWFAIVRWLLTTTERPLSSRSARGLGWFAVTPGTPSGAIAARSLVYWLGDPRYIVNFIVVPVSAVLAVIPLVVVGIPLQTAALLPAPLMALFFGWIVHNDLAYDSTALWMHIASAVRGTADRAGRLVPVTLIAVPLLALAIPITMWLHGRWAVLPAMIGVCASLFLCGLGLSSLSSVLAPYPASRPGDGPFQQPQRTGGAMAQGMVLLGALVLSAPALWWGWLALTDDIRYAWTALWGGAGIGAAVLVVGILGGGWAFERRSGRLMEFAESS